jgi:hypothetical protein
LILGQTTWAGISSKPISNSRFFAILFALLIQ